MKVYPNFDLSQVTNFKQYGSLVKRLSSSVTKIINYFPEIILQTISDIPKLPEYLSCLVHNTKIPLQTQITISLALYLSDRK